MKVTKRLLKHATFCWVRWSLRQYQFMYYLQYLVLFIITEWEVCWSRRQYWAPKLASARRQPQGKPLPRKRWSKSSAGHGQESPSLLISKDAFYPASRDSRRDAADGSLSRHPLYTQRCCWLLSGWRTGQHLMSYFSRRLLVLSFCKSSSLFEASLICHEIVVTVWSIINLPWNSQYWEKLGSINSSD